MNGVSSASAITFRFTSCPSGPDFFPVILCLLRLKWSSPWSSRVGTWVWRGRLRRSRAACLESKSASWPSTPFPFPFPDIFVFPALRHVKVQDISHQVCGKTLGVEPEDEKDERKSSRLHKSAAYNRLHSSRSLLWWWRCSGFSEGNDRSAQRGMARPRKWLQGRMQREATTQGLIQTSVSVGTRRASPRGSDRENGAGGKVRVHDSLTDRNSARL